MRRSESPGRNHVSNDSSRTLLSSKELDAVIGAIGVSGDTPQVDEAIALAGAAGQIVAIP
jgi:hypothetical protein